MLAMIGVHDSLHDSQHHEHASMHDYFHDVGQPHEHHGQQTDEFTISYSEEALEHSNANHDGAGVGIFAVLPSQFPDILPDLRLTSAFARLTSPFLKYTTPPPKF